MIQNGKVAELTTISYSDSTIKTVLISYRGGLSDTTVYLEEYDEYSRLVTYSMYDDVENVDQLTGVPTAKTVYHY